MTCFVQSQETLKTVDYYLCHSVVPHVVYLAPFICWPATTAVTEVYLLVPKGLVSTECGKPLIVTLYKCLFLCLSLDPCTSLTTPSHILSHVLTIVASLQGIHFFPHTPLLTLRYPNNACLPLFTSYQIQRSMWHHSHLSGGHFLLLRSSWVPLTLIIWSITWSLPYLNYSQDDESTINKSNPCHYLPYSTLAKSTQQAAPLPVWRLGMDSSGTEVTCTWCWSSDIAPANIIAKTSAGTTTAEELCSHLPICVMHLLPWLHQTFPQLISLTHTWALLQNTRGRVMRGNNRDSQRWRNWLCSRTPFIPKPHC
jgi:hypothetical protein